MSRKDYVLRAGQEYLVRKESETSKDWRWHVVEKVLYFSEEDLVEKPGDSYLARNYTFRRGSWLIAARPEQMYHVPMKESLREYVQLLMHIS